MTNILEIQSYHISNPDELLKTNESLKKENKLLFILLTISVIIIGTAVIISMNDKDESYR